jgi:competence protein ComEA
MGDRGVRLGALMLLAVSTVVAQDSAPEVSANPADRFPEAEGKESVTGTCSACHTLVRVATNRRSAKAWNATLKIHEQQRGLKLEPEEIPPIINYLAAWFGPMVNLNSATLEQLSDLPEVNRKLAEAIIAYREKKGPFKSVEEVTRVGGLPAGLLPRIKQRLEIGGSKEK